MSLFMWVLLSCFFLFLGVCFQHFSIFDIFSRTWSVVELVVLFFLLINIVQILGMVYIERMNRLIIEQIVNNTGGGFDYACSDSCAKINLYLRPYQYE